MSNALQVVCVKVGVAPYTSLYVNRLFHMVQRHLTLPFEFICMTDDSTGIEVEIQCVPPPDPWPGWWAKLSIFRPRTSRIFYLDLDTIIVSSLDQIASYDGPFAILEDFYQPTHYGSAIMSLCAGYYLEHVWKDFDPALIPTLHGGDQQWVEQQVPHADLWQDRYPERIVSYKVHCARGVPAEASVVCFHGQPRPLDVVNTEAWVQKEWR